jgi:hypothetical protein
VHWLRHTAAAAGHLATGNPDPAVDRISVESLTDTLAHFAELDDWASVTLLDVAQRATLVDDRFAHMCTCGAATT